MNGATQELALEARVDPGPSEYRFRTVDGVCSNDEFRTEELLLAEALWEATVDSVLVLEANYGVVGVLAAPAVDRVAMTESSARAARLCERNAARNDRNAARNGVDTSVSLTAGVTELEAREGAAELPLAGVERGQSFDALAYAPKPYAPLDLGAQRLADAASRLDATGCVFVAASERTGLTRYRAVLEEHCGTVDCVAERDGVRVLRGGLSEDTGRAVDGGFRGAEFVSVREFDATVSGVDLALRSVPGVFSASRVDRGTRLLAEAAEVSDGDRVLDLCCGYGTLGAYASQAADCAVWLTDDDRVSTACAERTLEANGVTGTVVTADGVDAVADVAFDRVLCNPPTHATDRMLAGLFADAQDVLAPGGEAFVVHHHDLDLRPQLAAFDLVEHVSSGREHVVVRAR